MTARLVLNLGAAGIALVALLAAPYRARAISDHSTPALADTTPATWSTTATDHRGQIDRRFDYHCPPGGSARRIWGTDVYTDDSSICTAAVHAGRISFASGGTVTIEMRPGQSSYTGSRGDRDIESSSYGSWAASFVFAGVAGPPPPVTGGAPPGATTTNWGTAATDHRGQIGQRFDYRCPPGGSARRIWGTDVYTDDSSICTAAVHAGVITSAAGGLVTIEMRPGQGSYTGSQRYGVQSGPYGAWSGSFSFTVGEDIHPPAPAAADIFLGDWLGAFHCADPAGQMATFNFIVWRENDQILWTDWSVPTISPARFSDEGSRFKLVTAGKDGASRRLTYTWYIDKATMDPRAPLMEGESQFEAYPTCRRFSYVGMTHWVDAPVRSDPPNHRPQVE